MIKNLSQTSVNLDFAEKNANFSKERSIFYENFGVYVQ